MCEKQKERILILEDVQGVTEGYVNLLEGNYELVTCKGGEAAQSIIESGERFDLAIVDINLPIEDPNKYQLTDCLSTGLRLIKKMIEQNVCHRFYVITVRHDILDDLKEICEGRAIFIYEERWAHKAEEFLNNVKALLEQPTTVVCDTMSSYLDKFCAEFEGIDSNIPEPWDDDYKGQVMALIQSLKGALQNPKFHDYLSSDQIDDPARQNLRRVLERLHSDIYPRYTSCSIPQLKKQSQNTVDSIQSVLVQL